MEKTILCFDIGQKKIGIALGNTITRDARPLDIIYSEVKKIRFEKIQRHINTWQPDYIVIGLALTEDGQEQPSSLMARKFARQIEAQFHLSCVFQDETGSSIEAQELLQNNQDDDAMAACVILQRHLDQIS